MKPMYNQSRIHTGVRGTSIHGSPLLSENAWKAPCINTLLAECGQRQREIGAPGRAAASRQRVASVPERITHRPRKRTVPATVRPPVPGCPSANEPVQNEECGKKQEGGGRHDQKEHSVPDHGSRRGRIPGRRRGLFGWRLAGHVGVDGRSAHGGWGVRRSWFLLFRDAAVYSVDARSGVEVRRILFSNPLSTPGFLSWVIDPMVPFPFSPDHSRT